MKKWPIEVVKFSDVVMSDKNPRVISDENMSSLSSSIDQFGVVDLLVWNKRTKHLVGGHQRYWILISKGEVESKMVVVDFPEEQEIKLNITLNNPMIQGFFTEDVTKLLSEIEGSFGNHFNELALDKIIPTEDIEKEVKNTLNEETEEEESKFNPNELMVVTCRRCKSQWRKSDKKIIWKAESNGDNSTEEKVV